VGCVVGDEIVGLKNLLAVLVLWLAAVLMIHKVLTSTAASSSLTVILSHPSLWL